MNVKNQSDDGADHRLFVDETRFSDKLFQLISRQKLIALSVWILFIGGYALYSWQQGLSIPAAIAQLGDWLHSSYGPLLYLFLFVLRSLLFFSAGILSIAGGIIFAGGSDGNLLLAFFYVMIGTWTSALISFGLARYFGASLGENHLLQERRWMPYLERLRHNGFLAVLLMRLLLLPFDPINYLAGFAKVQWRAFALATFLGIIPTAFAFTSFGAAIDLQMLAAGQMPDFDWRMVLLALIILGGGLLISRYIQSRNRTDG